MDTTLTLPASLQGPVDEAIARAVGERWASRLWERDTSLWSSDHDVQDRIWARLGWLAAPTAFEAEAAELTAFGEAIEAEGFSDAIVMGMGGSSLAPEVLSLVYPESDKGLTLHVLDSTHPDAVAALDAALDPQRTLRVVATKSGTTTETLAFLAHHWEAEEHRVGRFSSDKAGDGFVSVSDPGDALEAIPHSDKFREIVPQPRRRGRPLQRPHVRRPGAGGPAAPGRRRAPRGRPHHGRPHAHRRRGQPGPRAGSRHGRPGACRA